MRIEIKTDGFRFRVGGPAKPKQDYRDKSKQAVTRDGRPIWAVRLDAIDAGAETRETIWVEVAGEEPKLTTEGLVQIDGLVFAPWIGRDGKNKRPFRADTVTALADARKNSHAA